MGAHNHAANLAAYYARGIPTWLYQKPLTSIAEVINGTNRYCREYLPAIIIERNDPLVTKDKEEACDQ